MWFRTFYSKKVQNELDKDLANNSKTLKVAHRFQYGKDLIYEGHSSKGKTQERLQNQEEN